MRFGGPAGVLVPDMEGGELPAVFYANVKDPLSR